MIKAKYCFLDLETTGLDPEKGVVLEVAAQVTDANFNCLGGFNALVWNGLGKYGTGAKHNDLLVDNDYVRTMHTKNGLLKALAELTESERFVPQDIDRSLCEWVKPYDKLILAGSTISFDRAWLKLHMPQFHEALHYRNLDVSSLKMMAEDCWGLKLPKAEVHRAAADVQESLLAAVAIFSMAKNLYRTAEVMP